MEKPVWPFQPPSLWYVPANDGSEVAKKIASIEYDFSSPAPLHLNLEITIGISYIEKKFQNEKDLWEMIVEKARDWLQNTDIIIRASEFLNSQ